MRSCSTVISENTPIVLRSFYVYIQHFSLPHRSLPLRCFVRYHSTELCLQQCSSWDHTHWFPQTELSIGVCGPCHLHVHVGETGRGGERERERKGGASRRGIRQFLLVCRCVLLAVCSYIFHIHRLVKLRDKHC